MQENLLIKAVVYAAEKHKYQRRKGFNQVPYINHPLKVSKLLSECGENDDSLLIAAILHDVVEDTDATEQEIADQFGTEVSELVMEVTDNKELPYAIRKNLQVKGAPGLSEKAKKLKIADKTCNIIDILTYPLDWSTERKLSYLEWAKEVVDGCRSVNPDLEKNFDDTHREGYEKLQNEL
ncbi:MAG: HD domain-containing protein [Bacteroidota bacterium]